MAIASGSGFGLLIFPVAFIGLLLSSGDPPLYLTVTVALIGAVLAGTLFGTVFSALLHRTVKEAPIPVDADPADVRAAHGAVRSGELTGRPEADRIARALVGQFMKQTPRLGWSVLFLGLMGGFNLFNAAVQYRSDGELQGITVVALGAALVLLVILMLGVPLYLRYLRRARALARAYDARREGGSRDQS